jgi:plastocyanin
VRAAAAACFVVAIVLGLCSSARATITRSGTLHATVTDNFRAGESTMRYTLQSGSEEMVVRPTELAAEPGDRVVGM